MNRSSVSEQISLLEKALSSRLLHRTTRRISVTQEGNAILPYAKEIHDSFFEISAINTYDRPSGLIRISTTQDFAIKWLVPRLRSVNTLYPDIEFDLVLSDERLDMISHNLDLAIRIGKLDDASYVARTIYHEPLKILASQNYINRYGSPKTLKELQEKHTWIALRQMSSDGKERLFHGRKEIQFVPKHKHTCDGTLIQLQLIESGFGLGLYPVSLCQTQINDRQITTVMPRFRGTELNYYLVYPSRQQIPFRVKCVIDTLMKRTQTAGNSK